MRITADTSFLCALYRKQDNSERALAYFAALGQPLSATRLLLWEFRQSVRFQAFRHSKDRRLGFPYAEAERMIAKLRQHLDRNAIRLVDDNLTQVLALAERVSKTRTFLGGHRSFDVLHIAAALEMEADAFLSFDANQNALAAAEGLSTPLAAV
ncbi:MAG TPA: PIN domain-containing protein [Bacteroidia bacterium]|nr:PIN domain-containing protein [Bacteroidia bacterium]